MMTALLFLNILFAGVITPAADRIVGQYLAEGQGNYCKVRIVRDADGTYSGSVYWVRDSIDAKTGKVGLDVKNPDKSLRKVPLNRVKLFSGLRYNPEKAIWEGAKVYHPALGVKADARMWLNEDNDLRLRGTVMGIGMTVTWKRL